MILVCTSLVYMKDDHQYGLSLVGKRLDVDVKRLLGISEDLCYTWLRLGLYVLELRYMALKFLLLLFALIFRDDTLNSQMNTLVSKVLALFLNVHIPQECNQALDILLGS